jgi:hypothetical protein
MTSYFSSHPEMAIYLVHLTGRHGTPNSAVPASLRELTAPARLEAILNEGLIYGFDCFGSARPVVCFCEGSTETLNWLVTEGGYEPWGLSLRKDHVYAHGGGPAYYVRSEELPAFRGIARARAVRFEPHACDWTHEREWRVPTGALRFRISDVEGIYVGDAAWKPTRRRPQTTTRPQNHTRGMPYPSWWHEVPRYVWNGRDSFEPARVQSAIV